jgi:hypothetical protein
MGTTMTIPDTADDVLVRLGDRFVSPPAAQLHIFGVLLGAHLGAIGFVPDADLATLPEPVRDKVDELVDVRLWWPAAGGYRIDPEQAIRTMRESLDRLNDPERCVATGSKHVRGENGTCARCGAPRV